MAGKEIAVKKYVVRLDAEERDRLNELIRKGKRSAQLLTKARILAYTVAEASVSRGGPIRTGWNSTAAAIVVTSASAISLPMLEVPG